MPRKKSKIISRETELKAKASVPYTNTLPKLGLSIDDVKRQIPIELPKGNETDTDRVFRLIYEKSREGYCFTEPYSGIPWIRYEDIEDKGNGLFIIRFRCPTQFLHDVHFGKIYSSICSELNSELNFFHTTKYEYRIPYEDCVWVLQKNGRKDSQFSQVPEDKVEGPFDYLEEFPDDFKNESTTEELLERLKEAIENFL